MFFSVFSMIFWTVFVLGVLVFFHELGHFLAAKISGIRVERFSIGYPPRLFGFKWGDTDYCISAVPLGGYCKMAGMVDESLDTEGIKGESWEFLSKPIPVRMFTLIAGPMANFILAIVLFAGLVYFTGVPVDFDDSSKIGNVTPATPAAEAGLLAGDIITEIDDVSVSTWDELTGIIRENPEKDVVLKIDRDGSVFSVNAVLAKQDNPTDSIDAEVGMLGIERAVIREDLGMFASLDYGMKQTWYLTTLVAKTAKSVIFGDESVKSLGGPLMIAKFTDESRKSGVVSLVGFMAFLSLNLGFMNLLPIPVLDGGHLMILSAELIARRQLPIKIKLVIQQVGMAMILALIVVILYNDVMRFVSPG